MSGRLSACALMLLAALLVSKTARAAPELFVSLDFHTDPALRACPTDAAFRVMVESQLGYDPFREGSEHRVVVRADAAGAGIEGAVEWYDASGALLGQRRLSSEHPDCEAFARGLSFAIAVQIQLMAEEATRSSAARSSRVEGEPVTRTDPAPAPDRSREQPPPAEPPRSDQAGFRWLVGAGPAIGVGIAPRVAYGAKLFVGLERGWLGFDLGLEASLPSSYEGADGAGFEQQVTLGSASTCALFRPLSSCLVGKFGSLRVRGTGVEVPLEPAGALVQLGTRLALSSSLGGAWIGALRVEGLVALTSWEVRLNQRAVWKTPPLSLSIGADVAALFQ